MTFSKEVEVLWSPVLRGDLVFLCRNNRNCGILLMNHFLKSMTGGDALKPLSFPDTEFYFQDDPICRHFFQ